MSFDKWSEYPQPGKVSVNSNLSIASIVTGLGAPAISLAILCNSSGHYPRCILSRKYSPVTVPVIMIVIVLRRLFLKIDTGGKQVVMIGDI